MKDIFNAIEIFEVAEKIELDGEEFYRKAANLFSDSEHCDLFIYLADQEVEHAKFFNKMKNKLLNEGYEPEYADKGDIEAIASLSVFALKPDPARELHKNNTIKEVLENALWKEKHTIYYYNGMKDFVKEIIAIEKLDEILEEEAKHVQTLNERLKKVNE